MKEIILNLKKTALIVLVVLCSSATIWADNFTAINNGNYSDGNTWQGGVAPGLNITADDDITINSGVTVSLDQDISFDNTSASLTVMGTLSGNYNLNMMNGSISGNGVINLKDFYLHEDASLFYTGDIGVENFYNYASISLLADLTVKNSVYLMDGNLSLLSDIALEDEGTLIFDGGNYLNLTGNMNFNGKFNLVYKANSSSIGAEASGNGLENLTINLDNNNNDIELQNDLIVNGMFDIQQGKFHTNNNNVFINGKMMSSQNGSIVGDMQSDIVINGDDQSSLYFYTDNEDLRSLSIDMDEDNQHVTLLSDLHISEDLYLEKGILSLNNHSLELAGMIASGGTGVIAGTENSNLTLTYITSIGTLRFKNDSNMLKNLTMEGGIVSLGSDLMIYENLNLTNGRIDIKDYNLELKENAMLDGGTKDNYIITSGEGSLMLSVDNKSEGKFFPIGNDDNYAPVRIYNNTDKTNYKARAVNQVFADGTSGNNLADNGKMVNGSWFIENGSGGNVDINLRVMWSSDMEVNNFQRNNAFLSHYTNNEWDISEQTDVTTETNGMYSIKRNNITSLSPFSVREVNTSSIAKLNTESVKVYPNPANHILNIDIQNNPESNISIMDMIGREVLNVNANQTIDISGLTNGVYIIKVDGEQVSKFTKQ